MPDKKLRLFIIEDNKMLCGEIWNFLSVTKRFTLAGVAHDGLSGLDKLVKSGADILLLDIILPVKDGLYVLEEIARRPSFKKPVCIVISSTSSETVKSRAFDLGADYYILKPFDMHLLFHRIIELYGYSGRRAPIEQKAGRTENIEGYTAHTLAESGVKSSLKGHAFLQTAITLAICDASLLKGVTKLLYPAVAKAHHTTPSNVERSIRHALAALSDESRDKIYGELFHLPRECKLTNSRFIKEAAANFKGGLF